MSESSTFDEIIKTLRFSSTQYENIYMDTFMTDYEIIHSYLVIIFKGGAMSVKNCDANSLSANLYVLSQIMNGGYYKEVDEYKRLKADSKVVIKMFGDEYSIFTDSQISDLLIQKIRKVFEKTNKIYISFGVDGKKLHEILANKLADKLPEYDFDIGYNYKCIARKKENK